MDRIAVRRRRRRTLSALLVLAAVCGRGAGQDTPRAGPASGTLRWSLDTGG